MRCPNSHEEVPTTPTIPTKFPQSSHYTGSQNSKTTSFTVPTNSHGFQRNSHRVPTNSHSHKLLNSNKLQNLFKVKLQQVSGICNIFGRIILPSVGKYNVGVLLESTTTFRRVLNDLNTLELVLTLQQHSRILVQLSLIKFHKTYKICSPFSV